MTSMRYGNPDDERALAAIDRATWSPSNSPVPQWNEHVNFFAGGEPGDVIVATANEEILGYVKLRSGGLISNGHVIVVGGLAVHTEFQRKGLGAALIESAIDEARTRGAKPLTLHVLKSNAAAIRLYERCGFITEGVLRGEFILDGSFVDDVLMAKDLTNH